MEELPTPVKGKADWRNYRALRLENGVTCLLVNDSQSKTLGMSTVVDVGAAADPRSMSGLAHFCEHMWYGENIQFVLSCVTFSFVWGFL
jgi:insulysin